jgi:hypothetical protein
VVCFRLFAWGGILFAIPGIRVCELHRRKNHNVNPAVLRAAVRGAICGDRVKFAVTGRREVAGDQSKSGDQ